MSAATTITADVTGIQAVLDSVTSVSTPAEANAFAVNLLVETFRPMGEAGREALYHLSTVAAEPDASRFRDAWMTLFNQSF